MLHSDAHASSAPGSTDDGKQPTTALLKPSGWFYGFSNMWEFLGGLGAHLGLEWDLPPRLTPH